jgi:lysozyme
MNRERLEAQLRVDEGLRLTVYLDTRGLATVGVGHLVHPADLLHVGDRITPARCQALFAADLGRTLADCEREVVGWQTFPGAVQEILANMAYNLGIVGLLKFYTLLHCVRVGDYAGAAAAMVQSRWYTQVGDRSRRLVARMRALADGSV